MRTLESLKYKHGWTAAAAAAMARRRRSMTRCMRRTAAPAGCRRPPSRKPVRFYCDRMRLPDFKRPAPFVFCKLLEHHPRIFEVRCAAARFASYLLSNFPTLFPNLYPFFRDRGVRAFRRGGAVCCGLGWGRGSGDGARATASRRGVDNC